MTLLPGGPMRLLKLTFRVFAAASLLVLSPSLCRAQGVPWYTIPLPIPNGFVDLATGNVHLEFRLGPPPARSRNGELTGSKITWDWTLYAYNGNISAFLGGTWNVFSANSHSGSGSLAGSSQPCPSGYPNGGVSIYSSPQFIDNHGTPHILVNQNSYTKQVNCTSTSGVPYGSGSDITSFNGIASDGSGYAFQVTNYDK
jgi:hypothetical protein